MYRWQYHRMMHGKFSSSLPGMCTSLVTWSLTRCCAASGGGLPGSTKRSRDLLLLIGLTTGWGLSWANSADYWKSWKTNGLSEAFPLALFHLAAWGTLAIPTALRYPTFICHILELHIRMRLLLYLASRTSWRMVAAVAFGAWPPQIAPIWRVVKHAMPPVALVTRATEHTSMTRSGILHRPWALFGPMWLGVAIQTAEILPSAALVSGQSLKVGKSLSSLDALI